MKELEPYKKFEAIPFSACVQECLDKGSLNQYVTEDLSIGKLSGAGIFTCVSKGNSFEIVNNKSGKRKSAFDFSSVDSNAIITCICDCGYKILLGIKCHGSKSGFICIYDPGTSQIDKLICTPNVPVSIYLIKEYGGAGLSPTLLNLGLKCMFGVVAVGTENGHVYLVDLRFDDSPGSFQNPSSLMIISPTDASQIALHRAKARELQSHCVIDLSYSLATSNVFQYVGPNGKVLKSCSIDECCVSSLMYLKQSYMLVIGFSFGCFQIWSLEHLRLIYSSPVGLYTSPVTNVIFQEPDDDPRHCCYLWIGRGPTQTCPIASGPTTVTLYQMLFEVKERTAGYGMIYKNLECVIRRFDHALTSDVYHLVDSRSLGSRIVTLKTLEISSGSGSTADDSESNEYMKNDSTICYVVWETPATDCVDSMSCHLGIFDMNQWYQKQMPSTIRDAMYGRMEAVCPFFAFYSLTDIAEAFLPNGILDVYIEIKSLNVFRTVEGPQSEQFYWPSGTAFKVVCVSESSSIQTEMLGIQRQIMADIRNMGTDSFLDTHDIISSCWVAGLLQNSVDVTKPIGEKRNADAMLSVSLEHGSVSFITNCIKKWSNGSITHAGHSLRLIYDWAWSQTVQYKKILDQLYIPIFCSITEKLEMKQLNLLKRLTLELNHLCDIFKELLRCQIASTEESVDELNARMNIIQYISLYGEVLLTLVHCGLLPEQVKNHLSPDQPRKHVEPGVNKVVYPYKTLSKYYQNRRKNLRDSDGQNKCGLFIDKYWQKVQEVDKSSDVELTYPPKTLESMCRLFLEKCNEDIQMSLIYYWILDICECYEELQEIKLPEKIELCLKLKKDHSLLVKALWLFDHDACEAGVEHLLLIESKIPSHIYHQIILTLYNYQKITLLTSFCTSKQPSDVCTLEETKFLIKILLQIDMLPTAYRIQSDYTMQSKKDGLFREFLQECKNNKLLGRLISLSLSADEEGILRSFLESSLHEDYRLVYYLERGLYTEAAELANRLRNSVQFAFDHMTKENVLSKCMLVDGFLQVAPAMEKRKLSLNKDGSTRQNADADDSPLSTLICKMGSGRDISTYYPLDLSRADVSDEDTRKRFFEDSFSTNQRRRKSPLFDGEVVSPTKKQKEMPSNLEATFQSPKIHSRIKNKSTISDVYLLLQTPPVSRSTQVLTAHKEFTKTPQSILKSRVASKVHSTKKKVSKDASPSSSQKNQPILANSTNNITPGRRIRFAGLASPTPPSSAATPSSSDHCLDPTQSQSTERDFVQTKQTFDWSFNSKIESSVGVAMETISDDDTDMDGSFQEILAKERKAATSKSLEEHESADQHDTSTVDEILTALSEQDEEDEVPTLGSDDVPTVGSDEQRKDETSTILSTIQADISNDSVTSGTAKCSMLPEVQKNVEEGEGRKEDDQIEKSVAEIYSSPIDIDVPSSSFSKEVIELNSESEFLTDDENEDVVMEENKGGDVSADSYTYFDAVQSENKPVDIADTKHSDFGDGSEASVNPLQADDKARNESIQPDLIADIAPNSFPVIVLKDVSDTTEERTNDDSTEQNQWSASTTVERSSLEDSEQSHLYEDATKFQLNENEIPPLFDSTIQSDSTYLFTSSVLHDPAEPAQLDLSLFNTDLVVDTYSSNSKDNEQRAKAVEKTPLKRKPLPVRKVVTRSAAKSMSNRTIDLTLNEDVTSESVVEESLIDESAVTNAMLDVSSVTYEKQKRTGGKGKFNKNESSIDEAMLDASSTSASGVSLRRSRRNRSHHNSTINDSMNDSQAVVSLNSTLQSKGKGRKKKNTRESLATSSSKENVATSSSKVTRSTSDFQPLQSVKPSSELSTAVVKVSPLESVTTQSRLTRNSKLTKILEIHENTDVITTDENEASSTKRSTRKSRKSHSTTNPATTPQSDLSEIIKSKDVPEHKSDGPIKTRSSSRQRNHPETSDAFSNESISQRRSKSRASESTESVLSFGKQADDDETKSKRAPRRRTALPEPSSNLTRRSLRPRKSVAP